MAGQFAGNVWVLGVSGGSGSGKTTFSKVLHQALGIDHSVILAQDSYYIDQSAHFRGDGENVNFDHPSALDFDLLARHLRALKRGEPVEVPIYDFVTHTRRVETHRLPPRPIVILDGTLILSQPIIRAELEASVFIETSDALRFERRLHRDTVERGRQPEGVRKQFLRQVKPMHDEFVQPSSAFATEIVSGAAPFEAAIDRWVSRLRAAL